MNRPITIFALSALALLARQRNLVVPNPTAFTNEAGFGVVAEVEGQTLLVGSTALLDRHAGAVPGAGWVTGS